MSAIREESCGVMCLDLWSSELCCINPDFLHLTGYVLRVCLAGSSDHGISKVILRMIIFDLYVYFVQHMYVKYMEGINGRKADQ